MTIVLIVLAVFFTAFMAYKMVAPFLDSQEAQLRSELLDEDMRRVEELVALKTMYMGNLRELEFDLETDKIAKEDYVQLKKRYERRTAGIMRELDELHGGRDWRDKIDAELERRQLDVAKAPKALPAKKTPDTIICPSCGANNSADARFCSQCATSLAPEPSATPLSPPPAAAPSATTEVH